MAQPQDLCTLANVREALEVPAGDTDRDALIESYITRASEAIMAYAEREFAPATEGATRSFRVVPDDAGGALADLAPHDLRTATTVTLNAGTGAAQEIAADTGYLLEPLEAPDGVYYQVRLSRRLAYSSELLDNFGFTRLSILGDWGWSAIPEDVTQAAIVTVASWTRRDVAAFALDDETGTAGRETAPTFPTNFSLPRAAQALLTPFRRWGVPS